MGPTVAIWPRAAVPPTAADLLVLASEYDPHALRLFLGGVGLDGFELAAVVAALGFQPSTTVHAFAYGNAPADHRLLAELALAVARRYDGLVDFGGSLGDNVTARRGWLVSLPYEWSGTFHIGDADFLDAWMEDPRFHMVE